jgi:hypothetical protein
MAWICKNRNSLLGLLYLESQSAPTFLNPLLAMLLLLRTSLYGVPTRPARWLPLVVADRCALE